MFQWMENRMSDECRTEVWIDNADGIYLYQGFGVDAADIRYACALRGTEGAEEAAEMFHQIEGGVDPLEEGWEYGDYESLDQAKDDYTYHFWADFANYDLVAATYFGKGTEALDPVHISDEQASDYMTHEFIKKLIDLEGPLGKYWMDAAEDWTCDEMEEDTREMSDCVDEEER